MITAVSLDFPWGGGSREIKAMMAEDYASRGAQAIEHTLDIAAVKNGDWVLIQKELADLTKAAQGAKTCAVIESCLLTAEELSAAAQCCQEAGLSCIALGTGKQKGPEWNDLMMLDELLGEERTMKIRYGAIGSFWTTALAINGFAAGADYLGITAVEQILKETPMLKALYEAVKAV